MNWTELQFPSYIVNSRIVIPARVLRTNQALAQYAYEVIVSYRGPGSTIWSRRLLTYLKSERKGPLTKLTRLTTTERDLMRLWIWRFSVNKSVFSFLVPTSAASAVAYCPHSPAATTECRPCSERTISPARRPTAAGLLLLAHAGTGDRQTDGHRAVTYRPCSAYYTISVIFKGELEPQVAAINRRR